MKSVLRYSGSIFFAVTLSMVSPGQESTAHTVLQSAYTAEQSTATSRQSTILRAQQATASTTQGSTTFIAQQSTAFTLQQLQTTTEHSTIAIPLQTSSVIAEPIKVIVVGLTHDHVHGILSRYNKGAVDIIAVAEADIQLQQKFAKRYHLPDSLFYPDLKSALQHKKPDAVLGYNAVAKHIDIVETCAPLGIAVMVEKPLAATLQQAKRMEALAIKYKIQLLTNFETTWYPSYHEVYSMVQSDSIGSIKKMVVHDGHQGPKEIGCSDAFLSWLTDPILNGAGALNDFGCYGADLATWFMKGQRPIAITAVTRQYKPAIYPKVDDDASIIVEYPTSIALIEASWNWPFSIKDLEVFGEHGYLHALDGTNINTRMRENRKSISKASALTAPLNDPILYLTAVLQGKQTGKNDLSSLEYNVIVMEILDAAKRSAASGKRIVLK